MRVAAIACLVCLGFAGPVALKSQAQSSGGSSKAQLAEVRSRVNKLEGATGKLRELMKQYNENVGQRPSGGGEAQQKWEQSLLRLLHRIEKAHDAVAEGTQRVQEAAKGELPTALAKDVANAHNAAEEFRGAAEHALTKHKKLLASKPKAEKKKQQAPSSNELDSDPLRNL